ncbi:MAG: outer membrane protein assembly factor BamD, partial [Desulfobacteraceae bacterium]
NSLEMNKSHVIAGWLFAGIFLVFSLGGCAWFDRFFGEDVEKSPAELMNDGMENIERGRYSAATEAFQNLKDRYPYSKFAITAELKLADTLYKRELYDEAFDAYDEFERLHPKNSNIPYVIYQKGMCHFSQVSTIDRDQSNTNAAKGQFERLVRKFPTTEYANRARRKIRQCYISLANYELYVGHYYYKMKKYRAAMGRYRYLLENYPDLGQYHEALEYLSKCKDKLAEKQENS